MKKELHFSIDCEWFCNFVRQRVWLEGLPFTDGLKVLQDTFVLSQEIAFDILSGRKTIVGINEGELVDDNKNGEYLSYVEREEKKKAQQELEADILLHPLEYFDPFAAKWSYKEFCAQTVDKGKLATIENMKDYFMRPPCEVETDPFLLGGMWSVDASIAQKKICNSEDKESFYTHLYDIVGRWLGDQSIPERFKRYMRIRQRAYELYRTRDERREARLKQLLEDSREKASKRKWENPDWVIADETNTYTMYNSSEGYYQRNARFVPCSEGVFSQYGLISPQGDFYACNFAGHKGAAFVIARQLEYLGKNKKWFEEESSYDSAKDLLFDKGWVFVNTAYGFNSQKDGPFYSKWGKIEDMPQKQMDTCYDWEIWNRNQNK